jgi:predicted GNAT family acetyltransferase
MSFNDAFIWECNECMVIGFQIGNTFYLYGKNWSEIDLEVIRNRINVEAFSEGFRFAGTLSLITDIFAQTEVRTSVFKNRIFYKITERLPGELTNSDLITRPTENDIEELAKLYQEYFKEEYKGLNDKKIEETLESIRSMISEKEIYISKNYNGITGLCTTMYSKSDQPMIGTVFVKDKYRGKGIGKALVGFVTQKLLSTAKLCYLMTEKENIAANKVMNSVGYLKIYEHTERVIG